MKNDKRIERPDQWPNILVWSNPIGRLAFFAHNLYALCFIYLSFIYLDHETQSITWQSAGLFSLYVLISLSACSRRLADLSQNRWWTLFWFVPVFRTLLFFYLAFGRSSQVTEGQ